ncbi:hypothetical protein MYX07_04445 [Patescibacteria group bacterium AH-259-L07]|nr:hypothetical protein [Patescibacteria group bacterium AH-259-L07]
MDVLTGEGFISIGEDPSWKGVQVRTSIPELKSLLTSENVIDYVGRDSGDYSDLKRLMDDDYVEDFLIRSLGMSEVGGLSNLLRVKAALVQGDETYYSLRETVRRRIDIVKAINIVLLYQKGGCDDHNGRGPYVRMVMPRKLYDYEESLRYLVEYNFGKEMDAEEKGFALFDVFIDAFEGVDLACITD